MKLKSIICSGAMLLLSQNVYALEELNSFMGFNFGSAYTTLAQPAKQSKEGNLYFLNAKKVPSPDNYYQDFFVYTTAKTGLINGIGAAKEFKDNDSCKIELQNKISDLEKVYGKSFKSEDGNTYSIPDYNKPSRALNMFCNDKIMVISVQDLLLTQQSIKEYEDIQTKK